MDFFGISSVSLSATQQQQQQQQQDEEEESQQPTGLKKKQVFVSQFPIRALPSNDSDIETTTSSIYIDDDHPFQVVSSTSSDQSDDGFLSSSDDDDYDDEGTLVEIVNEVVGFSDSLPAKIPLPPKARVSVDDDYDDPVGKDMVVLVQLDVNPVVKEQLVDSNSRCMSEGGGPFVEVKKMCLPGLDTSHIEENEFSATEVLVKTSMRRLDQELFHVDGCFDSKSVETDFGEGNSFVDDIESVQNLEHIIIITNPAIEILEQANFAIEEKDDCEKNYGGFAGSISKDSVIVELKEPKVKQDSEDEVNSDRDNGKEHEGSVQGSGVNHHFGAECSRDHSCKNNGHMAMEFDKEVDTDEVGDKKDLLDLSMLAALPNAASSAVSHHGNIGMTSSVGLIISTVKHSAGLGPSIISLQPTPRPTQSNCVPVEIKLGKEFEENMTVEAKKRLDMIKLMRVKFLRLLQRLGHSPEDSTAEQVLHQLFLATGRRTSQAFGHETARRTAMQLDTEGKDDLNLSLNILVLGKVGMGKSATINSFFGEEKTRIDAFEPATATVKEIIGTIHGVKIRVFDIPGLRTSVMEQPFNRKVLLSVKKCPPDIVFYVDRLDIQTRDLNDIPLLRLVLAARISFKLH